MWKVVLGDLKFMLVELVPLTLDMKFSKGGGCTPYFENDDHKEEYSNRLQTCLDAKLCLILLLWYSISLPN